MFVNTEGTDKYLYLSQTMPFGIEIKGTAGVFRIYIKNSGEFSSDESSVALGRYASLEGARTAFHEFVKAFGSGIPIFSFASETAERNKTMTKEELAAKLDDREYGDEITREEAREAKEAGLLVVFGASDDLAELRGAIDDEVGGGLFRRKGMSKPIIAEWCNKKRGCSWSYKTEMPHAEFNIYEDGELYCIGIVVDLGKTRADTPVKYCNTELVLEKLCEAFKDEDEIQEIIACVLDKLPAYEKSATKECDNEEYVSVNELFKRFEETSWNDNDDRELAEDILLKTSKIKPTAENGCEHCKTSSCATCETDRGNSACLHCDRKDAYFRDEHEFKECYFVK